MHASNENEPFYGTGKHIYEIHSPRLDAYLHAYNSDTGFDGLLTIIVHLTSECI